MNRREFFAKLLIAQAAFLILPAAKTYRRTWRQLLCPKVVPTPDYSDVFDAFRIATEDLDRRICSQVNYQSLYLSPIDRAMYEYGRGLNKPIADEIWTPIQFEPLPDAEPVAIAKDWEDVDWGFKTL